MSQDPAPVGRLAGHVSIVTGAASGIGRAVVERFLAEGASVVALDLDPKVRELTDGDNGRLTTHVGDVTDSAVNVRAVTIATERFGRLDSIVANAGRFDFYRPFVRMTPTDVQSGMHELMAINVEAPLLLAHAAVDALRATNGAMVFTLSVAASSANGGGVLYTATKHALLGAMRQLASELAPDIRVNGVAPGGTRTPLRGIAALGTDERRMDELPNFVASAEATAPLGFLAEPQDHASIYVLLASRLESSAMTGTVVYTDGGWDVRGRAKPSRGPSPT